MIQEIPNNLEGATSIFKQAYARRNKLFHRCIFKEEQLKASEQFNKDVCGRVKEAVKYRKEHDPFLFSYI